MKKKYFLVKKEFKVIKKQLEYENEEVKEIKDLKVQIDSIRERL